MSTPRVAYTRSLRAFFLGREWHARPYLLSPFLDLMMVGGIALLVAVIVLVCFPSGVAGHQWMLTLGIIIAWVSFVVNDPHFTMSYQLLYSDYRTKLQKFRANREIWARYIVAGIIAPAVMALYFLYILLSGHIALLAYSTQAMLFIVGWHYAKQGFGVFIMLSSMKKIYYSAAQRRFFLLNAYVVWMCYCLFVIDVFSGQKLAPSLLDLEAMQPHASFLPGWLSALMVVALVGGAIASLVVASKNDRGPSASKTAILGYMSMYYLLFPAAIHPALVLIYPAFHALQYLMFVYAYKRGEAHAKQAADKKSTRQIRNALIRFVLIGFIAGIACLVVPHQMEAVFKPDGDPFLFALAVSLITFVNIHHYFIDNVIWRKENAEVSQYLFHP